jgi:hypothetical protein
MIIKVFISLVFLISHLPDQLRLIQGKHHGKGKRKNELAHNLEELKKTEGGI